MHKKSKEYAQAQCENNSDFDVCLNARQRPNYRPCRFKWAFQALPTGFPSVALWSGKMLSNCFEFILFHTVHIYISSHNGAKRCQSGDNFMAEWFSFLLEFNPQNWKKKRGKVEMKLTEIITACHPHSQFHINCKFQVFSNFYLPAR